MNSYCRSAIYTVIQFGFGLDLQLGSHNHRYLFALDYQGSRNRPESATG